jgi:lipoprotein-releasing system permease protein
MNTELFIARRVAGSGRKSFTRLIIRIAVVAVALSVSVMIVASALIAGFKKEISSKVFGFWGHIHIADAQINNAFLDLSPISRNQSFYPSLDTVGPITYEEERTLAGISWIRNTTTHGGIRHIQTYALKPGIIKSKSEIEGIILKGVGQDFDWAFVERYLQEGSALSWDSASPSRDIIISRQTADRLRVGLGDRFVVHFVERGEQLQRRFTVRGIYKTGLEEYDKVFALADIRQVQQILGWQEDQIGGFEVFLDDWRDLNIFVDYIYYDIISNELYAETIREKLPEIFEWLQLQDINEVVILVMMTIVALINMVTALLILILERTNMIGILKSLGASDWSIRKIFLYHAAFIVMWGLALGNVIGIGLCVLQQQFRFIQLDEANYYLSEAPVDLQWFTVLGLNVGTLLVTLAFLVLPSILVARISPVKAIRFK